jgi:hypothetical protein
MKSEDNRLIISFNCNHNLVVSKFDYDTNWKLSHCFRGSLDKFNDSEKYAYFIFQCRFEAGIFRYFGYQVVSIFGSILLFAEIILKRISYYSYIRGYSWRTVFLSSISLIYI